MQNMDEYYKTEEEIFDCKKAGCTVTIKREFKVRQSQNGPESKKTLGSACSHSTSCGVATEDPNGHVTQDWKICVHPKLKIS